MALRVDIISPDEALRGQHWGSQDSNPVCFLPMPIHTGLHELDSGHEKEPKSPGWVCLLLRFVDLCCSVVQIWGWGGVSYAV